MDKEQEYGLIMKCRNGDKESFSVLAAAYRTSLKNYVEGYTENEDDAQDIVQECFQKAYTSLSMYDSRYSFSTWLYNIARNLCIDHYRKKCASSGTVSMDATNISLDMDTASSPEDDMIHNQSYESMIRIISHMESPFREVAELRFVKDYQYEEIAVELGIPLNTVRTRLYRARNILADKLKQKIKP